MPTPYTRDPFGTRKSHKNEDSMRMLEELIDAGYQIMCLKDYDGHQIVLDGPRFAVFKPFKSDDDAIAHAHDVVLEGKSRVIDSRR